MYIKNDFIIVFFSYVTQPVVSNNHLLNVKTEKLYKIKPYLP